ncbi:MAG: phosphoribosyltransferase family protein [Atopobium sp.]|uniref:ComF family protein n=1 Tax=Atopobium sp. TaxID=1872650 RepID=UPI002A83B9F6|nr:phosphoribosyltransferase family protein [Atopobium sp.]MDY4522877.1 phosphoribosyltransferase family protein [Atopobium sp.]
MSFIATQAPVQTSGQRASLFSSCMAATSELLWPTRCIGCNAQGELLCAHCRETLAWINQRWACLDCGAPFGWLTCSSCNHNWEALDGVVCATSFMGTCAHMVTALKDEHETRLAAVMAAAMATALDEAQGWKHINLAALDAVMFVPATHTAFVRRGFDHMELVARALSSFIDIPLVDVLVRHEADDQRKLNKTQRAANLAGTIELIGDVRAANVLLVDDVVTTGSSMCACAQALKSAGINQVIGCGFSRVW